MDIQKILSKPKRFRALTTLEISEFEELLKPFAHRWYQYIKHFTMQGRRRSKPLTFRQIESATDKLQTDQEKLFFILYFFKNNHLQESLGAQFDIDQGHISRWIKVLEPILAQSIDDLHLRPARTMDELVHLFRARQRADSPSQNQVAQSIHMDASEREIERNHDNDAQEHDYSGKQHDHTIKNTILSDESQFIHFLGFTYRGAVHDKTLAEEELPDFSALSDYDLWLSKDKAYQKYDPEGVHFLAPFKARRNHPLTKAQKKFNVWISSIRITCEHAIAGAKRCRVVKDRIRYFDSTFRDRVFFVACGLHNLRVTRRRKSYATSARNVRARINLNFYDT